MEGLNKTGMDIEGEAGLVIECLAREMQRARRWMTVIAIWNAMVTVRRMSDEMAKERDSVGGSLAATLDGVPFVSDVARGGGAAGVYPEGLAANQKRRG